MSPNSVPSKNPSLIAGGRLLADWRGTDEPADLLIADGRVAAIARSDGERAALKARAGEIIDATGLVIMPGMINAHHHAYSNVLRGTENSLPLELWALYTVAYGKALDAGAIRLAILLGAAEMLRHGVTGVIDHFPHIRHAGAALAAHRESGLRVGFAPFIHDVHDHDFLGMEMPDELRRRLNGAGFPPHEFFAEVFRELAPQAGGRVALFLGPNAPQRCSPELLRLWVKLRDQYGLAVHTHLLETRAQAEGARAHWPEGLVVMMAKAGLLTRGLSVAHGIWLDVKERDMLARAGVAVSHNPASNLMLGSGAMATIDYLARGVAVGLGSDSANTGGVANPFELMRLAMSLPRIASTDFRAWPGPRDALRMATEGGAAVLQRPDLGRIALGGPADLVLYDPDTALTQSAGDTVTALVQHGGPHAIRAVMIGGDWALRDGRVLAFDEDAARTEYRDRAGAILDAAKPEMALVRDASPWIAKHMLSHYGAQP